MREVDSQTLIMMLTSPAPRVRLVRLSEEQIIARYEVKTAQKYFQLRIVADWKGLGHG